jgi:hypothetical protein
MLSHLLPTRLRHAARRSVPARVHVLKRPRACLAAALRIPVIEVGRGRSWRLEVGDDLAVFHEEIVGTMTDRSRIALSPHPRDLYIEETLRQAEDGTYYPTAYGLGAFVSGSEIESVEWVSSAGLISTQEDHG